ncbi:MAG TPA: thiopurine S-methyltransferase [Methylophilaceae bacterium]|nr:thiopurine S-methyltransferase [Methylophilaceae bacterium]
MEASFWYNKWQHGEIAFHQNNANPLLVEHFEALNLAKGSRVFLPLCGKTLDISWLLAGGYRVVGAELSKIAIDELFQSLGLKPEIAKAGELIHYSAKDIDIYVGDIFELSAQTFGVVDAIYDRAAIVALPAGIRKQYATHLLSITHAAQQLIITYEYDQSLVDGPPFSVNQAELKQHYSASYSLTALETREVEGGIKGKASSIETAWLLKKAHDEDRVF